mgnify:CR=1 FL=1
MVNNTARRWLNETPASQYIPYSSHVTENIVSTHKAEYVTVWKVTGRSHLSASQDDVSRWLHELNNTIRGFASPHVELWSHVIRHRVNDFPEYSVDNSFCQNLNDNYKAKFADEKLMVNDIYLSVVYRQAPDKFISAFSKAEKLGKSEKKAFQDECISSLEEINSTLKAALKPYDGRNLGLYEHNGYMFSEVAEFFSRLINGDECRIPVTWDRLSEVLPRNRVLFPTFSEVGEVRNTETPLRFGVVEITDYPARTESGQLNGLLESEYEFVLTQSFSCLAKPTALDLMKRQHQHLNDSNDVSVSQIEEIEDAMDMLQRGEFVMGEHHATLTVFGENAKQVRGFASDAINTLADVAIIAKRVDMALEPAWWAQLPGNAYWRPRPVPFTSLNFLSFSPLHNFISGRAVGNPWGPAITMLKTVSGTPYYFNFHAADPKQDETDKLTLGNTMLIGQSGSGKTVLLGFIMAQAQRVSPTIVAFDKDQGQSVAIRAMGGKYLALKTGESTGLAPFQIDMNVKNKAFLVDLLKTLVTAGGHKLTHHDEVEITGAVNALAEMPKEQRSLTTLQQFLPDPIDDENDHPSVSARLKKWCAGNELGWVFDNEIDSLDLTTHRLYGFDITDFLDNPAVRGPLMMYLLYRTENMIDGRKFAYFVDEFWKPLLDPYFQDMVKNKQLTIRKQNGIFVLATQEPGAILESDIAKTLVQQSATLVFLPNPKADYDDYVKGMKLSETEFELIRSLGENSRKFLVKQNEQCAIAKLDLGGMDDDLTVLSGSPERAEIAESVINEVGDDPDVWLPLFLERVKGGVK